MSPLFNDIKLPFILQKINIETLKRLEERAKVNMPRIFEKTGCFSNLLILEYQL